MSPHTTHLPVPLAAALLLSLASTGIEAGRAAPAAPAAAPAVAVPSRCVDEEVFDTAPGASNGMPASEDPRLQLAELVREALSRSQAIGAAQLLAEAAQQDVEEARSAKSLQASIGGNAGPGATRSAGVTERAAMEARLALNANQLLYDGGRTNLMTDWRAQLAESARYGQLSQQEQLAVNTVALALERSRYRMQAQVYGQYARKMGCLVEALDTIVRSDRGRASELLQARKSFQQAELSMTQAQSQMRQVEVRLRRLVGDGLPPTQGLSSVLLQVPELDQLQADAENAAEIAQMAAQANAADRYAQAVAAGTRPQLSWNFSGARTTASGGNVTASSTLRSTSVGLGVAVNIPLLSPGVAAASDAARKRAQAAALQLADAVESRRFRIAEVYEQTQSAFDRARRVGTTLRDSEQVRNFTLQQWQQLGRRSLFDVMSAESDHYSLRVAYVNAIHDGQQLNAILLSLGRGVGEWLR